MRGAPRRGVSENNARGQLVWTKKTSGWPSLRGKNRGVVRAADRILNQGPEGEVMRFFIWQKLNWAGVFFEVRRTRFNEVIKTT